MFLLVQVLVLLLVHVLPFLLLFALLVSLLIALLISLLMLTSLFTLLSHPSIFGSCPCMSTATAVTPVAPLLSVPWITKQLLNLFAPFDKSSSSVNRLCNGRSWNGSWSNWRFAAGGGSRSSRLASAHGEEEEEEEEASTTSPINFSVSDIGRGGT
jgi:hypothetical protein